jgi:uncharacterized DUF497 family protein
VDVEWDPSKAASNLRKHGVDFAEAAIALEDPLAFTVSDAEAAELRQVTLSYDATGRLLVVVWTLRAGSTRIISAREATPRERREYEGGNP